MSNQYRLFPPRVDLFVNYIAIGFHHFLPPACLSNVWAQGVDGRRSLPSTPQDLFTEINPSCRLGTEVRRWG